MTQIPLTFQVSKMTVTLSPEMLTCKETKHFFENRKNEKSLHLFLLLHRISWKIWRRFENWLLSDHQRVAPCGITASLDIKRPWGWLNYHVPDTKRPGGWHNHHIPGNKASWRMAYSPYPWTQSVLEDGILTMSLAQSVLEGDKLTTSRTMGTMDLTPSLVARLGHIVSRELCLLKLFRVY